MRMGLMLNVNLKSHKEEEEVVPVRVVSKDCVFVTYFFCTNSG